MCQILCQAPYRYYHLILMLSLVDSIFSSILQMKRLRCKELKHAQGHSQNVTKPGPPDTKVQALSHYPRLDMACLILNDPLVELCFMNGLIQCFGGSLSSPASGALFNLSTRLPFQSPRLMVAPVLHSVTGEW